MGATTQSTPPRTGLTAPVLAAAGFLAMFGPLASDAFLPGLPHIADSFDARADQAQLALSGAVAGIALGQLVGGSVSDSVGRRGPLIVGASAVVAGAVAAAVAPSLPVLVVACVVIGLGGSFGMVVSRAVVSDLAEGPRLARGFSLLGTMISVGPIVAPVLGAALLALSGWRGIFAGLAVLGVVALAGVLALVPESHPVERRVPLRLSSFPRAMAQAGRSRDFWCGALVVWFAFVATWAYISSSSFVVQKVLGYGAFVYALVFAVGGVAILLAGLLAARLSARLSPHAILAVGLAVLSAGALLVLIAAATDAHSPYLLLPGMVLLTGAGGLYLGPSLAHAVHDLRHIAGTALAVVGALQFGFSAVVSPLVGIAGEHSIVPFASLAAGGSAAAWLAWFLFRPQSHRPPSHPEVHP